jgi:MFS family permease
VSATDATAAQPSLWSPFRHKAFAIIWSATVVANIGAWMYSAAASWLMAGLDSDPLMVSLVQVASTLPVFLFALPAGALADIVDKRRFLIGAEGFYTIASTAFAALVWLHLITPATLLLFVFLIEAGGAVTAPAWQSVVPQLVPQNDLPAAVSMNSVGVNISRTLGPALGGFVTARFGIAAPFWVNAVSNLGTLSALVWWRSPHDRASRLPAEHFMGAIRTGIRYAWNSRYLQATLVRGAAFFLSASCYWALLPLVARHQIGGGATLYGVLLGAIGVSAIAGAFALPWLRAHVGPNQLVAAGSIGTALTLVLFGAAHAPLVAVAASLIAGASWIVVLATLNVSAQFALPQWVRARGLAVYVTGFFGALTLGSVVWGQVARVASVPLAHFIAAAAAVLAIPLTWRRWQLQTNGDLDLTPSMHWPTPLLSKHVDQDAGPVLVTLEYRVNATEREAFLRALDRLSHERHRDGAYSWGIFEDVAESGRFVETFLVESWLEHQRQHERVTNADRVLQEQILHLVKGEPTVTHLIASRPQRDQ